MSFVYSTPVSEVQIQAQATAQATGNSLGEIRDAINGLTQALNVRAKISELGGDLNAETAARQSDTACLRADLRTLSDTVTTEIGANLTALRAETNSALDAEEQARIAADIEYYGSATALVTSEAAFRQDADNALDTGLTDEIQARIGEVNRLSAAVENERTDRANAVSNLGTTFTAALNGETSAREAAVAEIQSAVARAFATLAPTDCPTFTGVVKLPTITNGSAEDAAATKSYVDNAVANVNVSVFTSPTATADGTAGLLPAPKATTSLEVMTNLGWRKLDDATITIGSLPVQAAALTYTGAVQSPTWLNFDATKMQITGETSGSDARTYAATVKPIDLFVWADTKTQEERSISWRIDALKLAKPAAAVTEFNYNRLAQGLTVSNFDEAYMSQSGTVSATNARDYSAVYELKSKVNTTWSDGSTGDVVIPWRINVLKLAKPAAAVNEFVFDGDTKSVAISGYNNNYMNESGVKSASLVGSYSVIYALLDGANTSWEDGSTANVTVDWAIIKRELTAAQSSGFAQSGVQTYTGNELTVAVTNFDASVHVLGGEFKATGAGTYTATVAPAGSYTWSDGTTAPKSFSWTIGKAKVAKPAAASTAVNYTGATVTFVPTYAPDSSGSYVASGDKSATAINAYAVRYNLRDTDNYEWADGTTESVTLNWAIVANRLSADLSGGFAQATALTYNGQTQTVAISHTNATYHTVSGDTQSDAGSYSATIEPVYGYAWADGTTAAKSVAWSIGAISVSVPYLARSDYEYTGAAINAANDLLDYDSGYVLLSGDLTKSEPSTYTITAALKNAAGKANYAWSSGGTGDKQIAWRILGKPLAKPTFGTETVEFTYSGGQKSVVVNGYQSTYMDSSGTLTATDAGTYTIIYALKDTATTRWEDNTTAPVVLTWKINRQNLSAALSTLSASGEYYYNEKAQTLTISGYNANYHEVTGNSGTSPGNYTASVTLKPNYAWSDGTTAAKKLSWTINRAVIKLNMSNLAVESGVLVWRPTYVYSGNSITVTGSLNYTVTKGAFTGTLNTGGVITATNAGSYSASAYNGFVHFVIANNTTNFETLTIGWAINRKSLTVTQSTFSDVAYTYDGAAKANPFPNYDAAYHSINRVSNQNFNAHVNAGTYSHTISVNGNYAWSDGSTGTKTAVITINPAKVTKPTAVQSEFVYSGNAVNFLGSYVNNYDSGTMNVSGATAATIPGDYTAAFALKNSSNYHWADDSVANVELAWKVSPYPISRGNSDGHAQATALTWSGSEQTVTISNVDAEHTTVAGTVKATNAGSYTATLTPKQYCTWYDGTTAAKTVTWAIAPQKFAKPTCSSTETPYSGSEINWLTVGVSGYDSANMTVTGTTAATNLGNYSFTITLQANRAWTDGSTGAVDFSWSVVANYLSGAANVSEFYVSSPDCDVDDSVYYVKGGQSIPVVGYDANYHVAYNSLSNSASAWNLTAESLGEYTKYIAPKYGYCWSDGTTTKKPVTFNVLTAPLRIVFLDGVTSNYICNIGDANTLDEASYGLGRVVTFKVVDHRGETIASGITPRIAIEWDRSVAPVIAQAKLASASGIRSITIYAGGWGTAGIKVTCDETSYYQAAEAEEFDVTVTRSLSTLKSWAQVKTLSLDGTLGMYGDIGDTYPVALSGTVGTVDVTGDYLAVCVNIGNSAAIYDYNGRTLYEQSAEANYSVWAICKRSGTDGHIAFADAYYGTAVTNGAKAFAHNTSAASNAGGWESSTLRTRCTEFYNALPSPLRSAGGGHIPYGTRLADNVGGGNSGGVYSTITGRVWAPSVHMLHGVFASHFAPNYDEGFTVGGDYFYSGNKAAFKHFQTGEALKIWTSDPDYRNNADGQFTAATFDGNTSVGEAVDANVSLGLVPFFAFK